MKMKKCTSLAVAVFLLVGLCGCTTEVEEKTVNEVEVIAPSLQNIETTAEFIGTVEAGEKVSITPAITGKVLQKNFKEGDVVSAGDVLFTIDDKEYQIAMKSAQANVNSAWANLEAKNLSNDAVIAESNEAKGTLDTKEMESNYAVNRANNDASSAKNAKTASDMLLYSSMASGDISGMVEAYKNSESSAKELYASNDAAVLARKNREDFQNYSKDSITKRADANTAEGSAELASSEAALSVANAELEKAKYELTNTVVKSPISGVVQVANVESYGTVTDQEVAYVIYSENGKKVSFYVSEAAKNGMIQGQKITFEKNGTEYGGTVTNIVNAVNPENGLFKIEAVVEGDDLSALSPDTKIKVTTSVAQVNQAITLPIDAVYYNNEQAYVYLAKDGKAVKTEVTTGVADKEKIQIVDGLTVSDQVISSWNSQIKDQADIVIKGEKAVEKGSK